MNANNRGALFMLLAMAGFAIEDALIKTMGGALPPGQIIALLGLLAAGTLSVLLRLQGRALFPPLSFQPPVVLRNLSEAVGTLCFVTALTKVDLALASAILQATPLMVTLGAVLAFGEIVGWRRWAAMAVGFAGVLIVLHPGLAGFEPAALWAVGGMFGLALRDLATRRIPPEIGSLQLSFQAFFLLIPTGALLCLNTGVTAMTGALWALMVGTALIGIVAYFAIVQAMRMGEVSFVTPFRYSRMVYALAIGMVIFGERPDPATWLGTALIVGAGLYTFLRERRLARRAAVCAISGANSG